MNRLLLVANSEREGAVEAMTVLGAWLENRACVVASVSDMHQALDAWDADAVIAFGGDGTILNVARRLAAKQIPVLGVNLGRLGYLAEVSPDDMHEGVTALLSGNITISRRTMLHVRVMRGDVCVWESHGLNDAVVMSGTPGRIGEWMVSTGNDPLTRFRGDGIVIATPTGSTAYSLSAGGPILSPQMRAFVFTPVCPHELANRPLVLAEDERLRVCVPDGHALCAAVDGQPASGIDLRDASLDVGISDRTFQLVHLARGGRHDILRRKLGWGGGTAT